MEKSDQSSLTNGLASASAGARECRLGCIGIVTADGYDHFLNVGSLITTDGTKVSWVFLGAALNG